jgi:hypothetical protein
MGLKKDLLKTKVLNLCGSMPGSMRRSSTEKWALKPLEIISLSKGLDPISSILK